MRIGGCLRPGIHSLPQSYVPTCKMHSPLSWVPQPLMLQGIHSVSKIQSSKLGLGVIAIIPQNFAVLGPPILVRSFFPSALLHIEHLISMDYCLCLLGTMLGRLSWWSSQSNGWKRCLKDYCTAYGGIINREKVTLPRCAGEDPTDEVPFVLSLCAAEKFIKSSSKKENFIQKRQHDQKLASSSSWVWEDYNT